MDNSVISNTTAMESYQDLSEMLATNISINATVNGTGDGDLYGGMFVSPRVAKLRLANQIVLTIISASMMIGMGCAVTLKELWSHMRRPWGILIGVFCQYGILPLSSFTVAHILQLHPAYAIGMLVVSCSPGGLASNLLTYWVKGDVSLSICMTTFSTFLAFGMMPLCLFVYSRSWVRHAGVPAIPYMDIIISLVTILLPVVVGMFIRYRWEKRAGVVSRVGGILGLLGIVVSLSLQGIISTAPYRAPWQLWLAAFMLPFFGFGLSYLFARLCKMAPPQRRTVGIETGMQNVAVALTVMALSFRDAGPMVKVFPAIYTLVQSLFVLIAVPLAVFYRKVWSKYTLQIKLVPREPTKTKKSIKDQTEDDGDNDGGDDDDDSVDDEDELKKCNISISNGDISNDYAYSKAEIKEEFALRDQMYCATNFNESSV